MKTKKKPLVRTDYALYSAADRKWWGGSEQVKSFARAMLYSRRPRRAFLNDIYTIIDVRCRPLSTRTKASKKRTK